MRRRGGRRRRSSGSGRGRASADGNGESRTAGEVAGGRGAAAAVSALARFVACGRACRQWCRHYVLSLLCLLTQAIPAMGDAPAPSTGAHSAGTGSGAADAGGDPPRTLHDPVAAHSPGANEPVDRTSNHRSHAACSAAHCAQGDTQGEMRLARVLADRQRGNRLRRFSVLLFLCHVVIGPYIAVFSARVFARLFLRQAGRLRVPGHARGPEELLGQLRAYSRVRPDLRRVGLRTSVILLG